MYRGRWIASTLKCELSLRPGQLVTYRCSKNMQREQASLSGEKDLKNQSVRSHQDEHNRSTLRLGQLRSKQERREREEAALRDLQDTLAALQAELKVCDSSDACRM
jgi:hypothetical protein